MRRIFKVSFYIRGNHVNKDGTCAVMIRLSLDGERISAGTTGISIKPELWDGQRQQLKGRNTEVVQTNKKLGGIRDELLAIAEKLEFEGTLALDRVKAVFLGVDEEYDTIGKLLDKYIKNVKEQVGVCLSKTSLSKYELCKKRFTQMLEKKYHCKDMSLKELNPVVVQDYKNFLMTDVNMCNNTAVKTMKTFRTVILHGIKLGVIHKDPFVGVHFHMEKVDRGFLTDEEISAIMTKHFDLPRLELVRDLFIFSCFTGLAYIDVKALTYDKIMRLADVDWIISKYKDYPKKKKGHVFPVFSNQKTNQYLKEIATACGIDKELTFHMARHTFATLTLSKGVPIESVSRMLGHTNIRTTQIYAKITNKKIEHDMALFFKDNTIRNFDKESINMTSKDVEEPKANGKNKDAERSAARA